MEVQDRLEKLIEKLGLNPNSFAEQLGISSSVIYHIIGGRRNKPGYDLLEKITMAFASINIVWLITGKGDVLKKNSDVDMKPAVVDDSISNVVTLTVDKTGNMMIPVADIKAAAGDGYMNSEVLQTSEFVQLPPNLIKSGKYFLCVRIKGASMSPTLQDGGYVVIRLLDRTEWANLISDRVYVVSDMEGMTYLKRVRNRFNNGFIVLTSDSPEKSTYPNFNLFENEISTIWYVEWYLSAKLPNIHDGFYSKLERLENNIDDINRKFEDLERKIKKI